MLTGKVTRRKALKIGAAASVLPLVHIRTAGAAGKVSIALWNHWVEDANVVIRKQIASFGALNKVEVQADMIDPTGNQILMIENAEALAKTGHDIYSFPTWEVQNHVDDLEPVPLGVLVQQPLLRLRPENLLVLAIRRLAAIDEVLHGKRGVRRSVFYTGARA